MPTQKYIVSQVRTACSHPFGVCGTQDTGTTPTTVHKRTFRPLPTHHGQRRKKRHKSTLKTARKRVQAENDMFACSNMFDYKCITTGGRLPPPESKRSQNLPSRLPFSFPIRGSQSLYRTYD